MRVLLGPLLLGLTFGARFFLNPLPYFLVSVPTFVLFTILRRKQAYWLLLLASWFPILVEIVAVASTNFRAGFLLADAVCLVTALLGLAEERPKEKLIESLGLAGKENREKVESLFYTFGRVERIEKVKMSQAYAIIHDSKFYFRVELPGVGPANIALPLDEIEEVSVYQSVSSNELYYPSLRDMFLPVRNVKLIGKPKVKDYFLLIRTGEDTYTFYEEPATVLRLQEEIERTKCSLPARVIEK